ncbi:helix-turn-helix domain-containing protein [Micromonospora sp. NPDC049559]|uniref:helix-turn-helix domain-containing protein n=1 Tax=Micromonospora sp. NPDC049559 TaxID=3155923 RepID=UPI0034448376
MTEELTMPIGQRVAYWRHGRGLTQQLLADQLGRSKSWVEKVERGVRTLDRFSVLQQVAGALRIDVQLLLAAGSGAGSGSSGGGGGGGPARLDWDALRTALERYPPASWCLDRDLPQPDLRELRKAVDHAWLGFQHAGYDLLVRSLPGLLQHAQAADAHHHRNGDEAGRDAAHLLGQAYQIASSVLRKLGAPELAWLAADRATAVSARADDPLLAGVAASRAGNALLALGRTRSALEAQLTVAHRLAPGGPAPTEPAGLAVHGQLLLQAAMAAARQGEGEMVRELLHAAERAAAVVGDGRNHYWTSFGPTNVALHRVAAAVELGEGGRAVRVHQEIPAPELAALPAERRAQHLLDLAHAYAQVGDAASAGAAPVAGDRLAPAEIRYRPVAHEVMSDARRRVRGTPPPAVADLATRMGAAPH